MVPKPRAAPSIIARIRQLFLVGIVAVLITLVIVVAQDWRRGSEPPRLSRDNPPSPESFAPQRMLSQQPPITAPKVIAAKQVQDEVESDELVLGVVIDGAARAYPINGLTGSSREIYNDALAGRPIAATW